MKRGELRLAEALVRKKWPKTKPVIKELTDHGSSFVFLVKINNQGFILRVGEREYPLENNFLALRYLEKGTKSPRPIAYGKEGRFTYSIESFISGKKHKTNIRDLPKLIKTLRARIHKHTSKKCGYLSDLKTGWKEYFMKMHVQSYRKRFSEKVKDADKYFDYIERNFPKNTSFSLLHGDFSFTNSLFDKNNVYFFDFEDSFFGEKEYDLAMMYYMEFLPEKDVLDNMAILDYDKYKILFYALCIGIRKVALAKGEKYTKRRLKKLKIIYQHLLNYDSKK